MSILKNDDIVKKLRRSFNLKIATLDRLDDTSKKSKINKSSIVDQALNYFFDALEKESKEENKKK